MRGGREVSYLYLYFQETVGMLGWQTYLFCFVKHVLHRENKPFSQLGPPTKQSRPGAQIIAFITCLEEGTVRAAFHNQYTS